MKVTWFHGWIKFIGAAYCIGAVFASGWWITEARASNNYTSVVLADNPAGYWRLGEANTGLTAEDLSTNGNNGSYVPGVHVHLGLSGAIAGDPDTAAKDDPAFGGIATVPDSASLNPTTITLEAWLTADSLGTYMSPIMKAQNNSWNSGYGLWCSADKKLNFFVNGYASPDNMSVTFGTNSAYRYVVATYDGSMMKMYIDGSLVASNSYVTTVSSTSAALSIGTGSSDFSGWGGKVDEVAIYDYALTSGQVLAHYNAGISANAIPEPTSLVMLLAVGLGVRWRQRITGS